MTTTDAIPADVFAMAVEVAKEHGVERAVKYVASALADRASALTEAKIVEAVEIAREHLEIDGDNEGEFIRFDSIENAVRAILDRASRTPVDGAGWRPIETAPKDGEPFIIGSFNGQAQWCSDIWAPEYLVEEQKRIREGFYGNSPHLMWEPTHWMPLPAAPGTTASKHGGDHA